MSARATKSFFTVKPGRFWTQGAMRLRTREPYTLTAEASVKATLKLIEDRLAPGTYTPSMAFGADYVLTLDGVIFGRAFPS